LKRFNEIVNEWVQLDEQEPVAPVAPDPAAAPPPVAPSPAPGAGEQADTSGPDQGMSPAAEVTLVRLLLKALVINLEDSDLSTLNKLDQPEVTRENAEQIKQDVVSVINAQQTRGDNEDRIETVRDTMNHVNEKNSKSMLNRFIGLMKKYSDVNIRT